MDYSILLKAPLFKGITIEQIVTILSDVSGRVRRFSEGSMIALSGEKVNSLMLVLSGQVKGEMVDYSGKVIKIEDIYPPGALASAFIFGGRNLFPVNVISVSDTELLIIEKREFLSLLKRNEMILVNFLDIISNRSQFLSEKIKFLNFKTIKGKLAQFLLQKAGDDKTEITLEMTQNDLAEFFGVARPSIARAIGELEEGGYILSKGKHVKILDRSGLSGLRFE
jgi:CRP-like cAMP-binding protein